MKTNALRYFMHDGPSAFRFELAGRLDSEGANRLQRDREAASAVIGRRAWIVDLTFVTGVDEEGRALLSRWQAEGAQILAESNVARELAEGSIGKPLAKPASAADRRANWTWLPFHTSLGASKLSLALLLAVLLLPAPSHAASLKAETVAAWDDYVQSVSASLRDHANAGGNFLWTFEDSTRIARVHGGEILVSPVPSPRKVPGGLIHHWISAAFLPGANLDDTLAVTQDYDRYKEFYQPSVIASKTIARKASLDTFWMLLTSKAFFLRTSFDADYQVSKVRIDDRRFYSASRTTRMQEVEDYGQPGEHRIPEGEGSGYIWKMFNIVRLEQRDGGVYVEIEALALSRTIPGAVRFVVEPIVRRESRNSMLTSIQQTADAVRSNSLASKQPANPPADAEHIDSAGTVPKSRTAAFAEVH